MPVDATAPSNAAPAAPKKKHGLRETLAALRQPRVAAMLALGFASGLPFLLTGATFGFWLDSEGTSRTAIAFISWVGFAYSLKFLWSPFVDRLPLPVLGKLGRRRSWVLLAQLLVAAALVAMAIVGPTGPGGLAAIGALALVVAFASATQDIAFDAWRIEAAADADELSLYTSAAQLGYRIALLVTDSLILIFAQGLGWPISYSMMALLMGIGMVAALYMPEPARIAQVIEEKSSLLTQRGFLDAAVGPFVAFFREHGRFALVMLLMVSVYRLPEFVIGTVAGPFYHDLGLSDGTIGAVRGSAGLLASFAGIAVAGLSATALGFQRTLLLGAVLQGLGVAGYAVLAMVGGHVALFGAVMAVDNFCYAFGGVALVAYMSQLTSLGYTVTQYAFLSSIYTLVGKFLKGFSGAVVDGLEQAFTPMQAYAIFYIGAGLICLPAVALCLVIVARGERATTGVVGDVTSSLFEGRATRGSYARTVALTALVGAVIAVLLRPDLLGQFIGQDLVARVALIVAGAVAFVAVFMSATVRRLHDIGWSGRWALLTLAPAVGLLVLVLVPGASSLEGFARWALLSAGPVASLALVGVLLAAPGQTEANAHGPNKAAGRLGRASLDGADAARSP
jgi:PAT family beta-lactamase induction signal transducer AmpG